jgi:hypothetical protein
MNYCVTLLAVLFAACGWAFSAAAQVVPNRDSADYYFQRGNGSDDWPDMSDASIRKRSIVDYTKSIAFDSSRYQAYRNRGDCYQFLKDYTAALADYDRALLFEHKNGKEDASSVRFNCLNMCLRLARWSEAEAHCSALLTNPLICADTASNGDRHDTWQAWGETVLSCRTIWLHRAEARAKLGQYAIARQDYLVYRRQILVELTVEERILAKISPRATHYWYRAVPTKTGTSKTQVSPAKLTPLKQLPKHLQDEVLAAHKRYLAQQRKWVAKLRAESEAAAIKITELDKLLH